MIAIVIGASAASANCPREWSLGFHAAGVSALGAGVLAMTTFDDGSGPALYVGGNFWAAGDVPDSAYIARWDGMRWSALPGLTPWVDALAAFDDGSGPALYAGTIFGVKRWDGSTWQDFDDGPSYDVLVLGVFDDGGGPALYAGGRFVSLRDGTVVNNIAKWDGQSWSAVGGGVLGRLHTDPEVKALAVYDDGSGPALYVGGLFDYAGGLPAIDIARWDGQSWSVLGGGRSSGLPRWGIEALVVHDPPGPEGPGLYAAGDIEYAEGQAVNGLARWDGLSWSGVGVDAPGVWTPEGWSRLRALASYDDGTGPALYVGGLIEWFEGDGWAQDGLVKWDGAAWTRHNVEGTPVWALHVFAPPGGTPGLYLGGPFWVAGGVAATHIARLDSDGFSRLGDGDGAVPFVRALCAYDDGTGQALYVGGPGIAGDVVTRGLARWDGSGWSSVPGWVGGPFYDTIALTVYNPPTGEGPGLYVGASVYIPAEDRWLHVQRFDGTSWSALGEDVALGIRTMAVHDDGKGPALYVAGENYEGLTGFQANGIAKWDGTSWSALGTGISEDHVEALCSFDDGRGPALYVGGRFHKAGGVVSPAIARWDGSAWSDVGGGLRDSGYSGWYGQAEVRSLAVFDDGTGPALYVTGGFTCTYPDGAVPLPGFAKWDGQQWSPVVIPIVEARYARLYVADTVEGPRLYVSGRFVLVGTEARHDLLQFDGVEWSPVGRISGPSVVAHVREGGEDILYVGANNLILLGEEQIPAFGFGKWSCRADFRRGDLNCDGLVNALDIAPYVSALTCAELYQAEHPDCYLEAADCNRDGAVNVFDIDPFVEILLQR
ncbi:MAG: hypothetical protein GX547_13760 [Phycisphaerae bacterium]|nr:hypothetical protein [Phycisphaerae bacterium]